MTSDDRFDEMLTEAAREHNRPPETPRAEMWAAIAAARAQAREGAAPAGSGAATTARPIPVRVIPFYSRHRQTIGWAAGLAAALLIGVEIGRWSRPAATVAPAATIASAGDGATHAPIGRDTALAGTQEQGAANAATRAGAGAATEPASGGATLASSSAGSSGRPTLLAGRGDVRAVRRESGREGARDEASATAGARSRSTPRATAGEAALPYRVAAMQHLVTTEALLVSLRSDVREGRKDTTIAVWAGQLLGTTRMLIDSPAGRDPQLKQLLDDLELVLAQISRLPGARGEAADLGIIDDAVRHRQIMTRLRALSPDT